MTTYINISGYKFTQLTNLEALQENLKTHCLALGLKGTILLSTEGINVFLCAKPAAIKNFIDYLPESGLPSITFKESQSPKVPFKRMLVKIKSEIITMGVPEISPITHPAPHLAPTTFKHWLDEGKKLVILDTRNDYEVQLGKFANALDLHIQNFHDFPDAIAQLPDEYKKLPIVTYCTGGIRCEKAAPLLKANGFQEVYQLEGGILKYFEECGSAHYTGDCFVFDNRVTLNAQLEPTYD